MVTKQHLFFLIILLATFVFSWNAQPLYFARINDQQKVIIPVHSVERENKFSDETVSDIRPKRFEKKSKENYLADPRLDFRCSNVYALKSVECSGGSVPPFFQ